MSEHVACTECGADVTAEKIKFQQSDGSILCEECYILFRMTPSRHSFVRAIVVVLRFAACAILVLTFLSILSRAAVPDYGLLESALYGTLAFLLFIGLSEGLNIVLDLSQQIMKNRVKIDRILECLERAGALTSCVDSSLTL